MALLSPGVEVTLVDETIGTPASPGTVPLFLIATREDKVIDRFDGAVALRTAPGTTKTNAGQVYLVAGRTELLNTFGDPEFDFDGPNFKLDSELHEWGLHAAYEYLGQNSIAYVVRADIDLSQLAPSTTEPTSDPLNGTWWLDLTQSRFGVRRHNGNATPALAWDRVTPIVLREPTDVDSWIESPVKYTSNTDPIGFGGTIDIEGVTVTLAATDTLQNAADAINNALTAASITDVMAHVLRYSGESRLVLRNRKGGSISVAGALAGSSGFDFTSATLEYMPSYELGQPGDVAVLASRNDNRMYEKVTPPDVWGDPDVQAVSWWFVIGSDRWHRCHPTVVTGTSTDPVSGINVGNLQVTVGTTTVSANFTGLANPETLANIAAQINADVSPTLPMVTARVNPTSGALQVTNIEGRDLSFSDTAGGVIETALGLDSADATRYVKLVYGPHTQVPTAAAGAFWIITTTAASGAYWFFRRYDAVNDTWNVVGSASLYASDDEATDVLGNTVPADTVYVRYNIDGTDTDPIASHVPRVWNGQAEVTALGTDVPGTTTPALTPGDRFVLYAGQPGGVVVDTVVTVSGTQAEDVAYTINNLGLDGVIADTQEGFLRVRNTGGFTLRFSYTDKAGTDYSLGNTGDPLAELGLPVDTVFSNWSDLTYSADWNEPTAGPVDGQLWYDNSLFADIMVNSPTGDQWLGYRVAYPATDPKGPILSATPPQTQSDGTPLVDEDIWIDTSDLENWPRIYRWRTATQSWEAVDLTDQETPLGIVFTDARAGDENGDKDIADLLLSNHVDPDAPDPRTYPAGILLFNTRLSGGVVRRWTAEHLKDYIGQTWSVGSYSVTPGNPGEIVPGGEGRWVNASGNRWDGRMYGMRHAQRRVIVEAMREVAASDQVRSESIDFDLVAAPGYPELIDDLVQLSVDRKESAFVVGDTPMRLRPEGSSLAAWAGNSANVPSTSEEGLATSSYLAAVYYPWGIGVDTRGREIVIPPSTMALPVYAFNDSVAAPWFAPAGFRRGIVDTGRALGFMDLERNEFVTLRMSEAQRDVAYVNRINPIVFVPGRGIVLYGQRTLYGTTGSALGSINVVRLTVFLRRVFERIAQPFLFEINDEVTRSSVLVQFDSVLGGMLSARALYDYVVVCDETNNTPERIDRNELWIDVAIQPARAVEFIYIPVRVVDTGEQLS